MAIVPDGDRIETIQKMVRNYYAQVVIVERCRGSKYLSSVLEHPTDITLKDYLKGIGISKDEIEYAKVYDSVIPENEKTIFCD